MKFRYFIGDREKISIRELQNFFQGDKQFYDKLLKWVDQFNFTIDGDLIILKKENLEEFINLLDKQFRDWKKDEKAKFKKVS